MNYKSNADFAREIQAMAEKLEKETGRVVEHDERDQDQAGIRCDFELPYSTLPPLSGRRWAST